MPDLEIPGMLNAIEDRAHLSNAARETLGVPRADTDIIRLCQALRKLTCEAIATERPGAIKIQNKRC